MPGGASWFDEAVVGGAQEAQVAKVAGAASPPRHDVVGLASRWQEIAVGEDASAVTKVECSALLWGDESVATPDVEHLGWASKDNRDELGAAAQPP